MRQGADVTAVLGWGLRRYAWVIGLFVVALGIVVPAALERAPDQYETSAQVGPVRALRVPNVDVLPKLATDAFRNVPEAAEVKNAAGVPASEPVDADRLELVAAQDNIIFTVTARSSSPQVAQDTANVAAARFVSELNVYSQSVGSFSVTRLSTQPTEPLPRLAGATARGIGVAAGLLVGLGTVALLLLLRRPVIDAPTAEQESGARVLGRITLDRYDGGVSGVTQLCHRIVSEPTGLVLMVGPRNTRRERKELAGELVNWLSRVRHVIAMGSREPVDDYGSASLTPSGADDELIIIDDASPVEVATRTDKSLTLLVVREGISRTALREQAQQYLDGEDAAVVLVRRAKVSSSGFNRRQVDPRPAATTTSPPEANRDDVPLPFFDDPHEEESDPSTTPHQARD